MVSLVSHAAEPQEYDPTPNPRKFPYAGACLSTHPRLERVPGREFLDFQRKPVDAVQFLAANGFNAARLFVSYGQPHQSKQADNSNADHRENNYLLDFGGIDWQVGLARRVRAAGMRVVLTLQFGQDKPVEGNWHEFIPDEWLMLTYSQTLERIDQQTREMLRPFLRARIQPDIIIVENEADSGMLFQYVGADGKMHVRNEKEVDPFSDAATGIYSIWPKCAGYLKREILSARDELAKQGFDPAATRFAVHTTGNPFRARSTFDRIFNGRDDAEAVYYVGDQPKGVLAAVPEELRKVRLRDLVDIMGFSYYPPIPRDGSKAAVDDSLRQLTDDLAYLRPGIERFGRHTSGPFQGQWRKQVLVVEYSTATEANAGFDVERQKRHTVEFFNRLAAYEWTLGALWWEPTYANNNWSHHEGALYRRTAWDRQLNTWREFAPISTLQTWGSFGAR